jgi:hypothetical protein
MDDNTLEITPRLKDTDLHIWHYIGKNDRLVVCFSPTGDEDPEVPQAPSFPMAASNGGQNNVLFISDPQRTWLNGPGLREKIYFHVNKFKEEIKPTSVVTLGHSMGGFYAIACADDIGASAAVALAPQVSVHPNIAGDDNRWLNFRNKITDFRYESVNELLTEKPHYFIVHGALPREAPQRDRVPKAQNISHFILPEIHHNVPARLKRDGLQEDFINSCFDGDKAAALKILKPLKAYKRTLAKHPMLASAKSSKPTKASAQPNINRLSITYFFVMDGSNFEAPAILLAESLRDTLGDGPDIIAYTPEDKIGLIHGVTRKVLEDLGVEIRGFNAGQVEWSPKYPHGNKILASCERRHTDLSVFLDTDVICVSPPDFDSVDLNTSLFAVPEGVRTWGKNDDNWRPVYNMFELELPEWRVKLVKGRGRTVLPYFNAGVVGFVERGNAAGKRLPDVWLDTAKAIDANPEIKDKRPWLDQIALPIAAARMGGRVEVFSNLNNFSPYRLKGNEDLSHVKLLHYRMAAHYRKYEVCKRVTEKALERCTDRMRPRLRRRLSLFLRGVDLPKHLNE